MELEVKRQLIHAFGIFTTLLILIFGKIYAAVIMLLISISFIFIGEYRKRRKMLKILKIKPLDELEDILEEEIKSYERAAESPFNGAILFYFSCFMVTILFDNQTAIASIAVLALADSLSTLVGYYFGKHKLFVNKRKSWEGSISFFMASLLVLLFFYNPVKAVAVSLFVTFVEMLPHLNDNISVPLSAAFLLTLIS